MEGNGMETHWNELKLHQMISTEISRFHYLSWKKRIFIRAGYHDCLFYVFLYPGEPWWWGSQQQRQAAFGVWVKVQRTAEPTAPGTLAVQDHHSNMPSLLTPYFLQVFFDIRHWVVWKWAWTTPWMTIVCNVLFLSTICWKLHENEVPNNWRKERLPIIYISFSLFILLLKQF